MTAIVLYMLIYWVEGMILFFYCSKVFASKYNNIITVISISTLYIGISFFSLFKNPCINIFTFFVATYIIICWLYRTSIIHAFFHSVIISILMSLSELFVASPVPQFLFSYFDDEQFIKSSVILTISSKLLYFVILYYMSRILSKSSFSYAHGNIFVILISIIPITSMWVALTFSTMYLIVPLSLNIHFMTTSSCILLLLINFLVFVLYDYMLKKYEQQTQLQLQLQKDSDMIEYYKSQIQQDESQKILIHDIKKHFQAIRALNEQGETQIISDYIEQITKSKELNVHARVSDNPTLNAILSRYSTLTEKHDIAMHMDVRSRMIDFMSSEDITSLFCNLLENALESTMKMQDSFIVINVVPKTNSNSVMVNVINSCRVNPFDEKNHLKTIKQDPIHHGFGIRSIECTVDKYQGMMEMYYKDEDKTFHTIILFETEHSYE